MMLTCSIGAVIVAACATRAPQPPAAAATPATTPATTPTATPPTGTRVMIRDSFSPRTGAAAIRAFVPEIAPVDSGGECMVSRTGGSGATLVSATFPTRAAAHTRAMITFDSTGRLVRYSEQRGGAKIPSTAGMTNAQRDSTFRAAMSAVRTTSISLDYAVDQAIVMNRDGGRPTDAILGNVREIEKLEKFGPLTTRIERIRKLCGV
jgi:hypothetical protein